MIDSQEMPLRLGAKVPHTGSLATQSSIPGMARALEEAGFESLWVSDHIVMPAEIRSRYPFAADGRATWPPSTPYVDALIALGLIAAGTERTTIGTAVLVAALRHPVIAAKQLASIDAVSGGRLCLGVGVGWLREEFEALGVPFETRGARFEEWIDLLRNCWTGTPRPHRGDHYTLPPDMLCFPTPAHQVPVLLGGHSKAALRRAGVFGDGWLGQQSLDALDPPEIQAARAAIAAAARTAGRDHAQLRIVLRIVDSAGRSSELAPHLPDLVSVGVDEVIVDIDWSAADPQAEFNRLRAAIP